MLEAPDGAAVAGANGGGEDAGPWDGAAAMDVPMGSATGAAVVASGAETLDTATHRTQPAKPKTTTPASTSTTTSMTFAPTSPRAAARPHVLALCPEPPHREHAMGTG